MKKITVVNMNEYVEVFLTDLGKEIYYHQYDKINEYHGKIVIKPHYPKLEENGRFRTQLWMLFETFGEHLKMSMESPFINNELFFENEDKEVN